MIAALAHAHSDEVSASRTRERALHRLGVIMGEARRIGIDDPARMPEPMWRRYLRAQVACGVAMHVAFLVEQRHSRYYRAAMRVLRKVTP